MIISGRYCNQLTNVLFRLIRSVIFSLLLISPRIVLPRGGINESDADREGWWLALTTFESSLLDVPHEPARRAPCPQATQT